MASIAIVIFSMDIDDAKDLQEAEDEIRQVLLVEGAHDIDVRWAKRD